MKLAAGDICWVYRWRAFCYDIFPAVSSGPREAVVSTFCALINGLASQYCHKGLNKADDNLYRKHMLKKPYAQETICSRSDVPLLGSRAESSLSVPPTRRFQSSYSNEPVPDRLLTCPTARFIVVGIHSERCGLAVDPTRLPLDAATNSCHD